MSAFSSRKYLTRKQIEEYNRTLRGLYMKNLPKHHFILFGLPFFGLLLGGTYMLTFFTSLRYERHGERVTALSEEEQLSILGNRRKVDVKEDFYVCTQKLTPKSMYCIIF